MESLNNKGKRCFIHESRRFCWRHRDKCTRVWLWYTFAFVLSRRCVREQGAFDMMSSAKASGHMAANCIAPDLREKNVASVPTLAVTSFSSQKTKKFHCSPPVNNQNDWVYVPATTTMWRTANQLLRARLTFSKSLMVSVAVSKLGCSGLVFVAATTMINCCCNDCCQRSASSVFKSMRCCRAFSMRFYALFHAFS